MSLIKAGFSALGKLLIVSVLAATFLVGMVGVVYLSLRGEEVKVPEIVGKDFYQSEKELAALGLKVKKIAARYSQEKPNTILEQRPRAGDTAKTGLMISVVVSEPNPEGSEAPATIKKTAPDEEEEDTGTDLEPDQPKKPSKTPATKKPQTTRDVISNKSNINTNSSTSEKTATNSNNSKTTTGESSGQSNSSPAPVNKNVKPPPDSDKPALPKPTPAKPTPSKPAASGETRTRTVP